MALLTEKQTESERARVFDSDRNWLKLNVGGPRWLPFQVPVSVTLGSHNNKFMNETVYTYCCLPPSQLCWNCISQEWS